MQDINIYILSYQLAADQMLHAVMENGVCLSSLAEGFLLVVQNNPTFALLALSTC